MRRLIEFWLRFDRNLGYCGTACYPTTDHCLRRSAFAGKLYARLWVPKGCVPPPVSLRFITWSSSILPTMFGLGFLGPLGVVVSRPPLIPPAALLVQYLVIGLPGQSILVAPPPTAGFFPLSHWPVGLHPCNAPPSALFHSVLSCILHSSSFFCIALRMGCCTPSPLHYSASVSRPCPYYQHQRIYTFFYHTLCVTSEGAYAPSGASS